MKEKQVVEWVSTRREPPSRKFWRVAGEHGEAGKTVVVDGVKHDVLSTEWTRNETPSVTTHKGKALPAVVAVAFVAEMTIRKPSGEAALLTVNPSFWENTPRRLNPIAVARILPETQTGGFGGEVIRNAWIQYAEREGARKGYVEMLPVKTGQPAEPPAPPEYQFRRDGDFWVVFWEGKEQPKFKHRAGLTYLRELLRAAGKPCETWALYEIENPRPPEALPEMDPNTRAALAAEHGTGARHEKRLDEKTVKALRNRKGAIETELTEGGLTDESRDKLEFELERCEKALSDANRFDMPKEITRRRDNVTKAIRGALDAMADSRAGKDLMKHLRAAIHYGKECRYSGALRWDT